jgi:hypothetical protein
MQTLNDMSAQGLKAYIRGLYALAQFTAEDRQNMTHAKVMLLQKGFESIWNGRKITFQRRNATHA